MRAKCDDEMPNASAQKGHRAADGLLLMLMPHPVIQIRAATANQILLTSGSSLEKERVMQ